MWHKLLTIKNNEHSMILTKPKYIELTLAIEISATTVYSLNVEVPMKWYNCFPLQVNLDVPSGITP